MAKTTSDPNGLKGFLVRVTAAIVVALLIQTVALGFWCGNISARVVTLETHCHSHADADGVIAASNP